MKKIMNIKNLLPMLLVLVACSSTPDYKVVRQDVVALHDKLMVDGEKAIHNKMAIDTLLLSGKVGLADTATAKQWITMLNAADESMMDWMQDFKADVTDMSNAQAVDYFKGEQVKLVKMDSLYKAALTGSEAFLKKHGINTHNLNDGHDHSKH